MIVLLIALTLADIATTRLILNRGGVEDMPVGAFLFEQIGFWGTAAFKLAISGALAAILYHWRDMPGLWVIGLMACVLLGFIVANNVAVLVKLGR